MRFNRLIPAAMLNPARVNAARNGGAPFSSPRASRNKSAPLRLPALEPVFNASRRMASLEKDDNPLKPIMTKRWSESSLNPCWSSLTKEKRKKKVTWYNRVCVDMESWFFKVSLKHSVLWHMSVSSTLSVFDFF